MIISCEYDGRMTITVMHVPDCGIRENVIIWGKCIHLSKFQTGVNNF